MKQWKRSVGVILAFIMSVTGFQMGSSSLLANAAPNTEENAYMGVMLTEEEFCKFSYLDADINWDEYVEGENENGLKNFYARFVADGGTVDDVLQQLKSREKFYIQEGEDGYEAEAAAGADLSKTGEGYYAVIAQNMGTTVQTVRNLDNVKGVFFDTHYYNDLPEGEEPNDNTIWHPYTYKDLTVEVKAALTFRGSYSNLILKYSNGKEYPVVLRGEVEGSVTGISESGAESKIYVHNSSSAYGINGFGKTLFLPQEWKDEESNESGIARGMALCSPTGTEEVCFQDICAAELDENGIPQELSGEEGTSNIDINLLYHEGYIPAIMGSSNLGRWTGKNEETGEEESGAYNIVLHYYDMYEEAGEWYSKAHQLGAGEQVVNYKSARAWTDNDIWYDSPEVDGIYVEYHIDAQGKLYANTDRQFRVSRYADKEAYAANGSWPESELAESATLEGALQALAYDSEQNPDNAYYALMLIQDWEKRQDDILWKIELSNLSVPEKVKGLRLAAEGMDIGNGHKQLTGVLGTVNVGAGKELDLTGWYQGIDGSIAVSGGGTLRLSGARIDSKVTAANMEVFSGGVTAVASLTGMKTLNLCDSITVEKELGFAEDGYLNVTGEYSDAQILARSGSRIEIPNVNCVYDTVNKYGNLLEIFEEEKDGKRPTVIFTGERMMGDAHWGINYLNYQVEEEEADEDGWKPEYTLACPQYYYVPLDGEGNEIWEQSEGDLLILGDKVYRIEWDYESGNGVDKINLDGRTYKFLFQRLVETEYAVADVRKDTFDNKLRLIPYKASAVEEAAKGGNDIALSKNPYTDDSFWNDVWEEWNCEYNPQDALAEYYVSKSTKPSDIMVEYGGWNRENSKEYEGRSRYLYSVSDYLLNKEEGDSTFTSADEYQEENGVRKYTLYMVSYYEDAPAKSSHYVSEFVAQEDISLSDASKVRITTQPYTYTGSEIAGKPVVQKIADSYILKEGTDYKLAYRNNINAGTASVTVTAVKGSGFTGEATVSFTINPKPVSSLTVSNISEKYDYTGKKIEPSVLVSDGNRKLTGNDYTVSYSKNIDIGTAEIKIAGKGNYTGAIIKNFAITVKKNTVYAVSGYKYKIINAATNGKGTVSATGLEKNTAKKIAVADTVAIGGVKFQITSIEKNAFKNCKKATSATIGKNITSIGNNAFSGCTALKKVTIGKSVKTIGKNAFMKDSKLKTIKIKATGLKSVGKNAWKGIHKKATISVPKKQLKAYKKLLKGKGQASSVKIK